MKRNATASGYPTGFESFPIFFSADNAANSEHSLSLFVSGLITKNRQYHTHPPFSLPVWLGECTILLP